MRLRLGLLLVLIALAVAGGAGAATHPKPHSATAVSGGTLNVVAEQQVNGFNVYDGCCDEAWTAIEEAPVLLGAFVQAPDGSYQPQLVTSVDVTTSPSFTLTYHIDPNAVWNDGRPVTAGDFIYTWRQIMNPANSVASTTGYSDIASVTALDSKTVQAVFNTPYADWKSLFAPVLPEHVLSGHDFDTIWTNGIVDPSTGNPIGDGPFLMTGYSASSQITLTRNPRWWGPHPAYLNSIVFHVVTDTNTEESEMANGQVQAIFPTIGAYLSPLLTAPGVANQSGTSPFLEHLVFNVSGSNEGPLEDQAWVRQAIADSIDRPAIANAAFQPLVSVPASQSLIYFPYQAGYTANFAGYSYDASQVATPMTDHGCTLGGDSIWICGGQRMQFSIAYPAGNATRQTETSMMKSEAAAAGIDLEPDPLSNFFGSLVPGGFQIALYADITTGDPTDWTNEYICGGSGNFSGYCNTAVDDGFGAINADTDPAQREADANHVDQQLAADVPELPIFSRPSIIFYSTNVQGLVENSNLDGPLYDAQDVWLKPTAAAPAVTSFTPTQGTTGTSVTITGTGLTGTTGVSFDGTAAASFSVVSDTQVTATVASGTQTGPITVTGPGGSATSTTVFSTPATSGGPVSGGTLNVGNEGSAGTLNPYSNQASALTLVETAPVLEGAFQQQPDGSFQPELATSVDVTTSPSFTLTYHINPNAVWSDGQPVTATDFIFTWQTILANSSFASATTGVSGYSDITSMTALDSKTVQVSFDKVVAFWKELFSPVLPQHVLAGHDFTTVWTTLVDDPGTGTPIGDGPFLTTAATSNQLTLSRNANWWGPHPAYLNSIAFHDEPDQPTEVNDLTSGAVQAIYPSFSTAISSSLTSLRTTPGIATQSNPSPFVENIDFNLGSGGGPLEDQTWVRQAIADAIDRDAIVSSLFGTFSPTTSVDQSAVFFPFQTASYQPDFNAYSYSAAAVQSLMVAHGCTLGGDNIWICGGQRMQYSLEYISGNQTRQSEAGMIQSEAAAAGIDIEPDPVPMSQFFGTDLPHHTFQLALFAWLMSGDPSDWDSVYKCGGSANYPQYCNSGVDGAFNSVDTDANASQRITDANSADSLLAQDAPVLPLWSRPDFLAYSTKVRGLVDNSNLDGPFWDAQDIWMASSVAAPNVASFTPTKGSGGTTVTITGTGLTGATGVTFDGTAASSFSVVSDTQITATLASGTQSGAVTVTGPGGSGTSSGLFYTPPSVSGFTPGSAAAHSTVTLSGTSFMGASSVALDGASAPFSVVSNTKITFTVPSGASTGTIEVTAPAGNGTSAGTFTVLPPPAIAGISPGTGPVGTPVTITGTNLDHTVGIQIGGVLTVPTSVDSTQVVFSIPPGAVTGTIKILATNGSATSVDTFTVTTS
jgi:ABC-type transport system substrate-binding protein